MCVCLREGTDCVLVCVSGLTVEWTESDQKKRVINVPPEVYDLGCIQDVEAGLKV